MGFYGWRIVAVAFVCHFASVGFLFYSYGVFFKAVAAELGGSRLLVSLGLSVVTVVSGLCAPFVGRQIERGSTRKMILFGASMSAIGFALLSSVHALWQFHLVLLLVGVGTVAMGSIPPATLVARWFVLRRGTALGIATMGVSLSGLIMPTVATWLIGRVGWRGGFGVYAIATLVLVLPPTMLVVVDRPADMGLRPDGDAGSEDSEVDRFWSTRAIAKTRAFWSIALGVGLTLFAVAAVLTHLVPFLTDAGHSAYRAASLLSLTAAAGVIGKLAFGSIADRTDPRYAVWLSLGLQLAGLMLLSAYGASPLIYLATPVFGFGMGGVVPLTSVLTAEAFGGNSYSRAAGMMRPVMLPLSATGVPLAGYLYDRFGSYREAFWLFGAAYVLAALAIATLPSRGRQPTKAPRPSPSAS